MATQTRRDVARMILGQAAKGRGPGRRVFLCGEFLEELNVIQLRKRIRRELLEETKVKAKPINFFGRDVDPQKQMEIETLNPWTLQQRLYKNRLKFLPERPGIYFVFHQDVILYIGSSRSNMRRRHRSHEVLNVRWELGRLKEVFIAWYVYDQSDLLRQEMRLIRKHKPILNAVGNPRNGNVRRRNAAWDAYIESFLGIA